MLCTAEPLTDRHYEDDDCWVGDCVVCMTPMVVWRTHGLPDADLEAALLVAPRAHRRRAVRRGRLLRRRRAPPDPRPLARARASGGWLLRSAERLVRARRAPRSPDRATPSAGRRLRWSSVYSSTKLGPRSTTASAVATSTAVIVPDGAAAWATVRLVGQHVVPLPDPPAEHDRRDRAGARARAPRRLERRNSRYKRAGPAQRREDHDGQGPRGEPVDRGTARRRGARRSPRRRRLPATTAATTARRRKYSTMSSSASRRASHTRYTAAR